MEAYKYLYEIHKGFKQERKRGKSLLGGASRFGSSNPFLHTFDALGILTRCHSLPDSLYIAGKTRHSSFQHSDANWSEPST